MQVFTSVPMLIADRVVDLRSCFGQVGENVSKPLMKPSEDQHWSVDGRGIVCGNVVWHKCSVAVDWLIIEEPMVRQS